MVGPCGLVHLGAELVEVLVDELDIALRFLDLAPQALELLVGCLDSLARDLARNVPPPPEGSEISGSFGASAGFSLGGGQGHTKPLRRRSLIVFCWPVHEAVSDTMTMSWSGLGGTHFWRSLAVAVTFHPCSLRAFRMGFSSGQARRLMVSSVLVPAHRPG